MCPLIRTLIVDDEPLARQTLENLLAQDDDIELCGSCPDGHSALEAILGERPDLVLLDVQMPGLSGIQILERLEKQLAGAPLPLVIFVTAFDQYAIRAFDHHALDYLLKPFSRDRFHEAITRAKARIKEQGTADLQQRILQLLRQHALDQSKPGTPIDSSATDPAVQMNRDEIPPASRSFASGDTVLLSDGRLAIKDRGKVLIFDLADIVWFEAEGQYVVAHTTGTKVTFRESLGRLQKKLERFQYIRIHRSTIVNRAYIERLEPDGVGGCEMFLKTGDRLVVSRRRSKAVLKQLGL